MLVLDIRGMEAVRRFLFKANGSHEALYNKTRATSLTMTFKPTTSCESSNRLSCMSNHQTPSVSKLNLIAIAITFLFIKIQLFHTRPSRLKDNSDANLGQNDNLLSFIPYWHRKRTFSKDSSLLSDLWSRSVWLLNSFVMWWTWNIVKKWWKHRRGN